MSAVGNNSRLLLSEGQCYFGAGQLANKHYIPCGNAHLEGPQACCYEGDYCLSSNTCWNLATGVTYIAGCSDPAFRADTCPQRYNYPGQQWVALARCNGKNKEIWTGCAHHPDLIELQKENCNCNMSNQLIENPNGKGHFDEIGLLPNATGLPIAFNPTAIPSVSPTNTPSKGLSTGAKAGVGVGVAIGGLLLIAGAIFLFMRLRRQRKTDSERSGSDGFRPGFDTRDEMRQKSELSTDYYKEAHSDSVGNKSELAPEGPAAELYSPDGEPAELANTNKDNGRIKNSRNTSERFG